VNGRILRTCPLVLLDENNPGNKFSDKNLTGLLMALVPTIWAVLHENTSGGQSGKIVPEKEAGYTTGNLRQLHSIQLSFTTSSVHCKILSLLYTVLLF